MKHTEKLGMGKRIYDLRKNKGLTRELLSNRTGISSKFLYEIEMKDKGFSAQTLVKLCQALNVTADYILFGREINRYDQELTSTIEKFTPDSIELIKHLMEIAGEVGFRDYRVFTKVFKNVEGESPSVFRNGFRGSGDERQ